MKTPLLRNPGIFPSGEILKETLGNNYSIFESLMETITGSDYGLTHEWNYYKDGKSWLCKICHKKKTIFWLSVWDGYFKTSFFFTEKHLESTAALDIDEKIKDVFFKTKPIGRLIPMMFDVSQKEQLADLLKVIAFKKGLK